MFQIPQMFGQFFGGGGGVSMNVRCSRNVFFPGNMVEGVVELSVSQPTPVVCVNLVLEGQEAALVQHIEQVPDGFTETRDPQGNVRQIPKYREVVTPREDSRVIFRQIVTLVGFYSPGESNGNGGMLSGLFGGFNQQRPTAILPPGQWTYPFQLQLPQGLPPSYIHGCTFRDLYDRPREQNPFQNKHQWGCGVAYWLMGTVDLPQGADVTRREPITVVNMVPQSQYQNPGALSQDKHFDLTCCCCIPKGSVDAKIGISRTLIALDRDVITITADVDNSKGEVKLDAIHVTLTSNLTARVQGEGGKSTAVTAGQTVIPLTLEPGQSRSATGSLSLNSRATPTFRGAITGSEYVIAMTLAVSGASDESVAFPVHVVQSVDTSGQFATQFNPAAQAYQAQAPQQYYYQPPANAGGYNAAPLGPPPQGAQMLPPPVNLNSQAPPPMFQPL